MKRWTTLIGLVAAALLASAMPGTASARITYDPAGAYLDALDWPRTGGYSWVRFDANGIPQVQRGSEYVYNPVTISQYGLQEWSFYVAGQGDEHLAPALTAADWLVANQRPDSGAWNYDYDFAVGGMDAVLRAPWISAMAQGQAMSLLTRAWRQTGDPKYLESAVAALAPFRLSVADGGVTADFTLTGERLPYYEEYPTDPPSFTLNGFMFALIGLHDLSIAAPGSDAGDMFEQGMATLRAALPFYDTGGVSAYHLGYLTDDQPVHTSLKYHHVHVVELAALDSIAPDVTLELYRDRWAAYLPPPVPPAQTPQPTAPAVPAPAPPVAVPAAPATPAVVATPAIALVPPPRVSRGCRVLRRTVRTRRASCALARRVLRRYLRTKRARRGWKCRRHRHAVVCRRADHGAVVKALRR